MNASIRMIFFSYSRFTRVDFSILKRKTRFVLISRFTQFFNINIKIYIVIILKNFI